MKANLQQAIVNKTKEVLKESQELQVKFKINLKDKVSRQARYVDPSISEDQIKEICDDPEVRLKFYQIKILNLERGCSLTRKNVWIGKYSITKRSI